MNNVTSLLVLLLFFTFVFNIASHLYILSHNKKNMMYIYIFFGIIFYFAFLLDINKTTYKNLCFVIGEGEEAKNVHINYMNDKYLFIDNGNIVKIEEVEGFLNSTKCNQQDKK